MAEARAAFYALAPGGWRDYVTILHPPYTLWHLSYVVLGAGLAPELKADRLLWTLLAFFLALGIGSHALDELKGRPLRTRIPAAVLAGLAVASIGGACVIGIAAALAWTPWLLLFVSLGSFLAVAYNLELFGGRLHGTFWFVLAWGAFPVLTAYFATAEELRSEAFLAATFAAATSLAQRQLSTPVRRVRRLVRSVEGSVELEDGSREPVTPRTLTAASERALETLTIAMVALAAALLLTRLA